MRRTNGRLLATTPSPIPTHPKVDRPLDPAIDPDRDYSYTTKRGGKKASVSHNGGQAVRVEPSLGKGKAVNDARVIMVADTADVGPAAQQKAGIEQSKAPRTPKEYDMSTVSMKCWLMTYSPVSLNDEAFLRVMNSMNTKPTFNQHVQEKAKPAPASKAAELVEQPGKTTRRPNAVGKKPASALARSTETPAEAYRRLEARNKSSNTDATIRLAPTHEFGFPPPNTKSGGKRVAGDSVSVHTDGVESACTFSSADFKTQSSGAAGSRNDRKHGTIINGTDLAQKLSSATSEAASGSNGPGIHLLPPSSCAELNRRDDLITLEDGIEQSPSVDRIPSKDAPPASHTNSMRSSGVPHIMDEELNDDIPQSSLTPRSSIAPRFVTCRGARYIRCDLITGQFAEDSQVENRPESSGEPNIQPALQAASFSSSTNDKIAVTNGLNNGLQTLQESSAGSILGEDNLPGRSAASSGISSQASVASSRWANAMLRSTPESVSFPISLPQTQLSRVLLQQPNQHSEPVQKSQTDDIKMADAPTNSTVQQKAVSRPNLAASKYATRGVEVATRQPPVESATFHKSTKQAPDFQSGTGPNAFKTASQTASMGRLGEKKNAFDTAPPVLQENLVPTSRRPDQTPNVHSNASLKSGSYVADRARQAMENSNALLTKLPHKPANLTASIWSTANGESKPLALSNQDFGSQTRRSRIDPISNNIDSKEQTTAVSDYGAQHKCNPFGASTQSSKPAPVEGNKKFAPATPAQPVDGLGMAERSGNIPFAGYTPPMLRDRVEGTGDGAKTQSSMFNFSESTGSKPNNSIQFGAADGTKQGQPGGLRPSFNTPKPTNDLMASKYATSNASTSSFRKGRRTKADGKSSDESEI